MIIFNNTSVDFVLMSADVLIIVNDHNWGSRNCLFIMNGHYDLQYLTFLYFKGDTVKGYSKYPVLIQVFSIQISGGIKDLQIENKKRKNSSRAGRGTSSHRTESEVDSHDSSSISTLDQAVKQWMVAAAKGNS